MKMNAIVREIISTLVTFVVVFAIVWGVQQVALQPFMVDGHSMDYTLADRERLFMWKLGNVDRFDVVIIKAPNDPEKMYVKRVIGLPGDTVEVQNDQLILNGKAMDEPYLKAKQEEVSGNFTYDFTLEQITGSTTVPEGKIFVMGDNRQNSLDGRSFGFIDIESVVGEANVVYWPLNKIGLLDTYQLNENEDEIIPR